MKWIFAAVLICGGLFFSKQALAQDACGGTVVELLPAKVGNRVVGRLQLNYNRNNGLWCAQFHHSDSTWGKSRITSVELYVCKPGPQDCGVWQWDPWWKRDDGWYKYRAGPVRLSDSGRCIRAMGYIETNADLGLAISHIHCAV